MLDRGIPSVLIMQLIDLPSGSAFVPDIIVVLKLETRKFCQRMEIQSIDTKSKAVDEHQDRQELYSQQIDLNSRASGSPVNPIIRTSVSSAMRSLVVPITSIILIMAGVIINMSSL